MNSGLKPVHPAIAPANSDSSLPTLPKSGAASRWGRLLKFFLNPWLQLALNAVIVTASELFLKLGARDTAHFHYALSWTGVAGLASAWTWLGIVFVILSLIGWLYVLRHIPLSIAFPLSNAPHVLVPLTCWIFLHELISSRRWVGIVLVLIGLAIAARPFARIEEKL
jgi:multidrug transporter EmrE-like cation transporter